MNDTPEKKDESSEPDYAFEGCEDCQQEMKENDMEYTQDAYWDKETNAWICEHCGLQV